MVSGWLVDDQRIVASSTRLHWEINNSMAQLEMMRSARTTWVSFLRSNSELNTLNYITSVNHH